MSDFNEQLKKRADSIKLKAAEKRELRERVIAYMEYHPLPAHLTEKKKRAVPSPFTRGLSSEPFSVLSFNTRYFQSAFVLGALLLVVGVPSLAERSLPGDVLYPMKVLVNEEVRSTLAFSPYEKVEWEAARLERRLAEARLLAQAGKLTEAVEREVAAAVKKHSDSAQETILTLRESNTEEAALAEIAFTSVLAAQADIITIHEEQAKIALASNEEVAAPTMLASAVREAHSAALSTGQSPVTPEGMFGLIERETTYAAELFSSVEAGATEQDAKNIERRLADIGRKVARAQTLNASLTEMGTSESVVSAEQGSSTEGDATMMATTMMMKAPTVQAATSEEVVAILKAALTDTRKLISFMTDIEVRGSVDVEALVPLTPTDEERVAEVVASITTATPMGFNDSLMAVRI